MKDFETMHERIETMAQPEVVITKLSSGLGFGSGQISAENVASVAGEDIIAKTEALLENPDKILCPVDTDSDGQLVDDDGCSDGRAVKRVFQGSVEKAKSLNRPKVFGGGATMVAAGMIGTRKAQGTLHDTFSAAIGVLRDSMANFGAHTSEHVPAERVTIDSGCGAIDRAPDVVQIIPTHTAEITESIKALGVDTTGLDDVLAAYSDYAKDVRGQEYAGRNVVSEIVDDGKIVKQLEGDHREHYLILNNIRGYTINQGAIREVSDDLVQAFVIDVWRLEDISKLVGVNEQEQHKALLSALVYTLGTSAVLTSGDQHIYVVDEQLAAIAA